MKNDITRMHDVWEDLRIGQRRQTNLPPINFEEISSAVFSVGPCYYYVLDFYDMSISHISTGFEAAHGVKPSEIRHINDILALIHPEDIDFVTQAEKKAANYFYNVLGHEMLLKYKMSYNFRFRTASGQYRLYNHQSLTLTMDDNGNVIKSLNIHTDLSHLASKNNFLLSLIGLGGEPSFLRMQVLGYEDLTPLVAAGNVFSPRELDVIRLLAEGLDTRQIAEKLNISTDTVKTHRKNINKKSGCRNSNELVAKCMSEGWV